MATHELVTDDPELAAHRLANGGLAVLPTETVYGLGADATNDAAVARVFELKGRPPDHPLIVHLDRPDPAAWLDLGWITPDSSSLLDRLAARFWPGPLTVIVQRGRRISPRATGGRSTVGVRVPDQLLTQHAIELLGRPVAAPSANRFGRVSPTRVDHVLDDIGHLLRPGVDIVLDGGPAPCGVESTIVDATTVPAQILRHGGIAEADLLEVVPRLSAASGPARASGMLNAHYAPSGFVALADTGSDANRLVEAYRSNGLRVELIDRSAEPRLAARELYNDLRRADAPDLDGVVVVMPAAHGIGIAIRDRLQRAATGSAPPNPAR